jgi:anti-sigma regulatory factor (Ser/Thr protein kinase)
MATVELAFSALPVHVRTARLIVTAVARRSGVDEALLDEVRLAVGEACSRAVEAHRLHCPDQPVRLELSDDNGRFEVVVNDTASNGKPARPPAAASPSPSQDATLDNANPDDVNPNDAAPQGDGANPGDVMPGDAGPAGDDPDSLGLAVISGLVDDVEIAPTSDGTQIRMGWPVAHNGNR